MVFRPILLLLAGCGGRPHTPTSPTPPERPAAVAAPSLGLDEDLRRTQAFFDTRPTFERPLGTGRVLPSGTPGVSANDCGICHSEIAAEWALSTHAHAWSDRQFQAEILKSDNRWLCVNCHTPLLRQQAAWPIGLVGGDVEAPILVDNPVFDAGLREEGITCAACHLGDDGAIHGPGLASPSGAPHPVRSDERFRGDALCLRCHQATAVYPGKTFVCTFRTGDEWAAGPWAAEGVGCVDCHMPRVARPAANGGPVREVARHYWRGAGIPKVEGVQPPVSANPPGLGVEARWEEIGLDLRISNARAGHRLPSGDPERFVLVRVVWYDGSGKPVGEPWTVRYGQTWRWWPTPEQLSDDRLAPREQRAYRVPRPSGAEIAEVEASSHRMTPEIRDYHKLDGYPIALVTHQLRVSATQTTGGPVP